MASEVRIGELFEHAIGGGWGSDQPAPGSTEVAVIRGADFPSFKLEPAGVPRRFEKVSKIPQRTLQHGDIVLEISGGTKDRSTGRTVYISQEALDHLGLPVIPASFCRLLRVDPTKADPLYVYYWLQEMHTSGRAWLYQVQSTGLSNFQFKHFLETEVVRLPPIEEQRAIAEVLGALDDRIEWCGRLRASCVELLTTAFSQAALQRVAVGDLADVLAGQSPPGSTYNTDGEGLPFFQGSAQFGALVPAAEKWCTAPQRVAEPGDLLFSVRAPVGDLNVATEKVCIGRGLAAIRSPFRAATYAALTLAASAWSIHDGSGTVFGSINGRDLRATQVPWPDDVQALAPMLEALMDRALAADAESRNLAKTRDALLPRMLSGDLRIEDPARVLGAVA